MDQEKQCENIIMPILPCWQKIKEASSTLGLPEGFLKTKIHNGEIHFRMNGNRYLVNIELARDYLAKEDEKNMKNVQNALKFTPGDKRIKVRKVAT